MDEEKIYIVVKKVYAPNIKEATGAREKEGEIINVYEEKE